MKVTRHLCDLCGGLIPVDEAFAVLTLPVEPSRTQAVSQPPRDIFAAFMGMDRSLSTTQYDVCRGCVSGLVRAREFMREQRTAFEQSLSSDCAPR